MARRHGSYDGGLAKLVREHFPAQIQVGLKIGFHRYLTKPYMLSDLMTSIDDSLGYVLGSPLYTL